MAKIKLSEKFKEITSDEIVRMKIGLIIQKPFSTVTRWIKKEDLKLTQSDTLQAIEKVTGLKPNQVYKLEKQLA